MHSTDKQDTSISASLTLRYTIALGLVMCVLLLSYSMVIWQISSNEKDAHIVNISGMQRMLSQRIALMAREVYHADNIKDADMYAKKMRLATEKMEQNHTELRSGNLNDRGSYTLSPSIQEMYFGEKNLSKRVEAYTKLSFDFIKMYEYNRLQAIQQSSLTNDIAKIARNGLLNDLNDVVYQYERESQKKTRDFKRTETFVLLFGLLTLLMEVFFIFRPMVRHASESFASLKRSNEELVEFSYRISHDLRAPIVSSTGLSTVAMDSIEGEDYDSAKTAINLIKGSMKQLSDLIDDVLNLTKMKMNKVEPESVDLNLLVDEILLKVQNMPNAEHINIQKDISVGYPIMVQKIFLKQSLENLISNAIKYYDPDKDNNLIKIFASVENNKALLSVLDNGLGIPLESRDQLFSMFKRFHPKRSFGSGLGLYLVKQNVESLGGTIKYDPTDDGSIFSLKFPL